MKSIYILEFNEPMKGVRKEVGFSIRCSKLELENQLYEDVG